MIFSYDSNPFEDNKGTSESYWTREMQRETKDHILTLKSFLTRN